MAPPTSFHLNDDTSSKGIGTMNFTWRPDPVDKSIAFAALKRAIEINSPQKTLVNGGEFYGADDINLIYLKEFFQENPHLRNLSIVSIKGAIGEKGPNVNLIQSSIDNVIKYLPGLDIFEPARLDPAATLEEQIAILDENVLKGKIRGYTLSEIKGSTLAKAIELSQTGVKGVEVEFSLFSRDTISADNGLVEIAGKFNVPIIAYSPLSRGVLTGALKSTKDIPEGDIRLHLERFNEENFAKNLQLVNVVESVAKAKGVTPAQVSLAWIHYQSGKTINGLKFPKLIPIPSCGSVSRVDENFAQLELTQEEFNELNDAVQSLKIYGGRYWPDHEKFLDQ